MFERAVFMDIFNKAKDLFDIATVKTGEFVYSQKCNLQLAKVCAELKWEYERFGRLCFRKLKGAKVDDNEFDALVEKIEILKLEISAIREGNVEEPEDNSVIFEDGELVEKDW